MALVQGTGASQGRKKKKSPPRAGTQGRGGVNAPSKTTSRVVTKHVYRGVSFYSTTGRALPVRWQKSIIQAATKIPSQVWDRLAMSNVKILVQENKDKGIPPTFMEYLDGIGVPRKWANDVWSKDIAYTDAGRNPVAVVGIGALPNLPNGEKRPVTSGESTGHILLHETAHAMDFSFEIMKVIGAAYHGLDRKTPRATKRATEVIKDVNAEPFSTIGQNNAYHSKKTLVSSTNDWENVVPENYTAGYGDPTVRYDKTEEYPQSEVFAEALARYWNKEKIPKKAQSFFDSYFDEGW
jgi:hypothetical protein